MASLSLNQSIELIKTPKNRAIIEECEKHESRLKFHSEPFLDSNKAPMAYKNFINWVDTFLSKDKAARFKSLLQFPVPTIELTESIFTELKRSLEADNAVSRYHFTTPEYEIDFIQYLHKIKNSEFWKTQAYEAMKTSICSVLVVDLPAEQTSTSPEPYYYLLDICKVIDIEVSQGNKTEYLVFKSGEDQVAVLDDNYYRLFNNKDNKTVLIFEKPHDLGYCPARQFWSTDLNDDNHIEKKGPITNSLSQLDKVLFWEVAIEYYETYGVFPIYWAYEQKCSYKDEIGNECVDGFINYSEVISAGTKRETKYLQKACPKCASKTLIGPGSFLEVPAPRDDKDADLRDPVGIVGVDVQALEFVEKMLQKRKDNIFVNCVGSGGEPENNQAVNEKQILSGFESKQNVLIKVKENFEKAEKWTIETVARLQFGKNFVRANVSYGDIFYLKSPEQLTEEYKEKKAAGLPMYEIAQTREQISNAKYKNNPDLRLRTKILSDLEPFPDLSIAELVNLSKQIADLVLPEEIKLKANFSGYIKRFEREELDIVLFGSETDYAFKIDSIKQTLLAYAKENQPIAQPAGAQGNPAGGPGGNN